MFWAKKYGVQVQIGGDTACTDGSIIRLPTLPLETDDVLTGMVRGWIDHESGHIRETDFDVLKDKDVTPLIKNIWNIFEDWRVENKLAERFPGCRTNLLLAYRPRVHETDKEAAVIPPCRY